MDIIECGSASGSLSVGSDGVGVVHFTGLLVPANFLALGVLVMRAGIERGAAGLIYRNEQAAVCCDPVSMTAAYPTLAPVLRALPVAFVVNAGQAELYDHVVRRAADEGLLRRVFFEDAARNWLRRSGRWTPAIGWDAGATRRPRRATPRPAAASEPPVDPAWHAVTRPRVRAEIHPHRGHDRPGPAEASRRHRHADEPPEAHNAFTRDDGRAVQALPHQQ